MARVAAYGSWRSPIGADLVARAGVVLSEPWLTAEGVFWLELRPREGGRSVVVRADASGAPTDVTPAGFDVRTKVHEYGGGSYLVHDATVFFSNFVDQRLYRQEPGTPPEPITPAPPSPGSIRYADGRITPDGSTIVCVRERRQGDETHNDLALVPADGSGPPLPIASGRDFYAFPRIAPDGSALAWIEWDHPNMPWDGTELHVASLSADGLSEDQVVAGGERESIFQPAWTPAGELCFVSDRTGWWNLYRRGGEGPQALAPMDAEFGVPMWEFGYSGYDLLDDGRIVCAYRANGIHHLAILDPLSGELLDLDIPYTCFDPPYVRARGSQVVFVGGGPTTPDQVVALDLDARSVDVLRESEQLSIDPAYLSVPRPIAFPTEGGLTAFGYHYPPANPDHRPPEGELPPLIVHIHGGPTAESTPELSLGKQFWTSRGFAV
ncbi:MAG TPA: S9 family peptidase, partial [Actinomycetota bacterium]|nr:S9 family peptidase [Actinomycetota bacterium]